VSGETSTRSCRQFSYVGDIPAALARLTMSRSVTPP
jgi:hypothetical protein